MTTRNNIVGKIDWWILAIYLILAAIGISTIYAAAFNENNPSIFDMSQHYGKQALFLMLSLFMGLIIMLIDAKFFNTFAYIIYGISILLLIYVLVAGSTIAGSRSWIQFGGFSFQPSEFAKFGTALAVAHYLGDINTDFSKFKTQMIAYALVLFPMMLVLLQGDAGSALVFLVFILVFYREGMSGNILLIGLAAVILFLLTLYFSKWYVLIGLAVLFAVTMFFIERNKKNIWKLIAIFSVAAVMVFSVDFFFYKVLKQHQRTRINIILGVEKDIYGVGYNLHQSKIAIGSGGFSGKGYMQGTMTKYNFVPEQHTDFIFCTIGEEFGFIGSFVLLSLYLALLMRIIWLAERQRSSFSRIYGYAIASIIFFHLFVNIGMTIGLMPVIGIPLPFLSYGGSSLLMFSLMFFVFLKQDANRMNIL
ncbi:MAG: rod shape-determining protein RodA [Lentimicrobiaceae bacterium]|nr:rod shape-determining protein RodA [Lentimicrobiaceae bacterium]